MRAGGKHPLPPDLHALKKPSPYRVKRKTNEEVLQCLNIVKLTVVSA